MTDTTGKIAPDQGREIDLVLSGDKPLAVIEKRKDPEQYSRALQLGGVYRVIPRFGSEGLEVMVALDYATIDGYLTALAMPDGDAKTWCLGRLFGYSDEDIAEFITNPPACDCSKCSGKPVSRDENVLRDRRYDFRGKVATKFSRDTGHTRRTQFWNN